MNVRGWRWTYVALGLALRLQLLVWGMWQDKHATLPYTDVDFHVYNDGANALWNACRLADTVYSPFFDTESDLFDAPQIAEKVRCARGFLPAVARFVLRSDPQRTGENSFPEASALARISAFNFALSRPLFQLLASIGDPYTRATYRYTPWLAVLLGPVQRFPALASVFGKLLFALADIVCALLMWDLLDQRALRYGHVAKSLRTTWTTHLPGLVWLLNPFPAQISTRGNSDSVLGVLVLGFLALLLRATPEMEFAPEEIEEAKQTVSKRDPSDLRVADETAWYGAAFMLALAVHFKLYPVIYGASVLAHLATYRRHAIRLLCGINAPAALDVYILGAEFAILSGAMYALLVFISWLLWGAPFVHNALLYHILRQDHRHNFSVYFLSTYLTLGNSDHAEMHPLVGLLVQLTASPLASFVPQLLTVAYAGFALGGKDLVFGCAIQTLIFVAWNKVFTSQYFLWYLWFLPVLGVTMHFQRRALLGTALFWVGAQALWLFFAYRLEFLGQDTFVPLWLSGLLLLAAHLVVLQQCLHGWTAGRARQAIASEKSQ
ncbi:GPI mannosyltransferase 1 [Malassezia vespertilionis]|uniref:GPI mannosyltransferase 1 n=1 Tax=Malassezia vespertilionis TaxID=2020962 RepID=A0A2N1J8D5_9BASI|nr:GPI mannosyltransferase 1 [Malassezia vespertilionis]PKI82732.1 Gpi14p [Malassezia vespertilionis]WFD08561.1 GPI mannosyltransferase 1 [Malassezia vespertilionis]